MFLCLHYKHRNVFIIDIVYDTVMGCNVTRVGHVVSTYESLGKYDYAVGSTNVKSVSGGNVVFESTTLSSLQAIAKFIFKTNS